MGEKFRQYLLSSPDFSNVDGELFRQLPRFLPSCHRRPPMTADDVSVKLVARWQAGDQQAAAELFHRYAVRLIALASSRLSSRLATRVDPEDLVQSAYRSFFSGAREGQYELQQSGDLWRLLLVITLRKLHDQVRRHTRAKRDVDAQQH